MESPQTFKLGRWPESVRFEGVHERKINELNAELKISKKKKRP